jgi:uncharacterized membrane protein
MSRFALRRLPRRRGALTGLLLAMLGLWGALVPFVGPYFDFQIGTNSTWDWSADRFWLSVLPGAIALLGGVIMIKSLTRASGMLGGLLAMAAGLWFIAGPTTSMLWNDGVAATGPAFGDNGTRALEWIGFFYGTGALMTLLSSYELGFLAALPITGEATRPESAPPKARAPLRTRLSRRRSTDTTRPSPSAPEAGPATTFRQAEPKAHQK